MSPKVAGQCRQCSRPGAKRRDHAVVGGFPLRDFSVIGTTAEGFWARTVEHGVRATREPSRVGALRARHAAARPVRLFRRPGAERRQRRAQRGAPCSRSWFGSCAGVVDAHGGAVQLEAGGAMNETIEDGVREGRILQLAMPVGHRQLGGDDDRAAAGAVVEDFEEVAAAGQDRNGSRSPARCDPRRNETQVPSSLSSSAAFPVPSLPSRTNRGSPSGRTAP